jgi:hypothetical protein
MEGNNLLVVTVMVSAVGDSEVGLDVVASRILAIALKKSQGSDEVALFQKVARLG